MAIMLFVQKSTMTLRYDYSLCQMCNQWVVGKNDGGKFGFQPMALVHPDRLLLELGLREMVYVYDGILTDCATTVMKFTDLAAEYG